MAGRLTRLGFICTGVSTVIHFLVNQDITTLTIAFIRHMPQFDDLTVLNRT